MNDSEINRLFPGVDPGTIHYLRVLSAFHEGVTITDAQGTVLYMNEAQAKIDDLNIEKSIGKKITTLYSLDEGQSPTIACLNTGKAISNLPSFYRTHLGRVVNSIHNIYPITANNKLIGTICYITDFRNIEHTFDTVMQAQPPHSRPNGVADKHQNGTRFTFRDI